MVPGAGFEPASPRLHRGAVTRPAIQACCGLGNPRRRRHRQKAQHRAGRAVGNRRRNVFGATEGNRTPVCAWATRGSAIELRTQGAGRWPAVFRPSPPAPRAWRRRGRSPRDLEVAASCPDVQPLVVQAGHEKRQSGIGSRNREWRKADGSNATPRGCPPAFEAGCRPLQRSLPVGFRCCPEATGGAACSPAGRQASSSTSQ